MNDVIGQLKQARVVPVLRSATASEAISEAREYAAGGMPVVELTFSTPKVTEAIAELSQDPAIVVGAGTVMTEQQAHQAVDAGARFLVSPVWIPRLIEVARQRGVEAIPGAGSPSEIWAAHTAGAAAVKVFPIARLGGAAYIRDLLAPMPDLTLMATGGVNINNAGELLNAGCAAVGVGTVTTGPQDRGLPGNQRATRFLGELDAQ